MYVEKAIERGRNKKCFKSLYMYIIKLFAHIYIYYLYIYMFAIAI